MVANGRNYDLLRKLDNLSDEDVTVLNRHDKLLQLKDKAYDYSVKAQNQHTKAYNLKSKAKTFEKDQIVYNRNFFQSSKSKKFSSKLAPKFTKCKVLTKLSSFLYDLEDFN